MSKVRSIVVTGGPGAGKSTLVAALGERFSQVRVAPEVATALFSHLLPLPGNEPDRRNAQTAIYAVQVAMEDMFLRQAPKDAIVVFDRGLLDGAAYWPGGVADFFSEFGGSQQQMFRRYDAVVHMESASVGGYEISDNNATRREEAAEAVALDSSLKKLWREHPNYRAVPHASFVGDKITSGIALVEKIFFW